MSAPSPKRFLQLDLLDFVLVVLCVLVSGILLWVYVINQSSPRGVQKVYCINNLRQIDIAANQFALEHCLTNGDRINFPNDLTPYIKLNSKGEIPPCPAGGQYSINRVGKVPTCSLGTTVTPNHVLP
jgi:hypothetical protein